MPKMYSDDDLLMLSGIQHFAFCERQWALIHIEKQWAENQRTVEGKFLHERAHNPLLREADDERIVVRSLPLVSRELGLTGQADVVEFFPVSTAQEGITLPKHPGYWLPAPVEYKRGRPKPDDRDEVQLCAQALCLEEMLSVTIPDGSIYYGETRHRRQVEFSPLLRRRVAELAARMHAMVEEGTTPPAEAGHGCPNCSMVEICLPNLTKKAHSVASYLHRQITMAENEAAETEKGDDDRGRDGETS